MAADKNNKVEKKKADGAVPSLHGRGQGSAIVVGIVICTVVVGGAIAVFSIKNLQVEVVVSGMESCLIGALSIGIFQVLISSCVLTFELMTCCKAKPKINRMKAGCIVLSIFIFIGTIFVAERLSNLKNEISRHCKESAELCIDNSDEFRTLQILCIVSCVVLVLFCVVTPDITMCCNDSSRAQNNSLIKKFFSGPPHGKIKKSASDAATVSNSAV